MTLFRIRAFLGRQKNYQRNHFKKPLICSLSVMCSESGIVMDISVFESKIQVLNTQILVFKWNRCSEDKLLSEGVKEIVWTNVWCYVTIARRNAHDFPAKFTISCLFRVFQFRTSTKPMHRRINDHTPKLKRYLDLFV